MARPPKKGLSYFPFDVDIFEDDKLFDVQNEYGPLGEVIYIRLLCLIYRNGYYFRFESLDKLAAMIIKSVGNRWARDKKTVKEVILYLAECNLFSLELMQRNVITSRSIQKRYLTATGRRQSKLNEYNLLEEENQEGLESALKNPISVAETDVNATETQINVNNNVTKEKKSKVKERKGEEKLRLPACDGWYILTVDFYNKLVSAYPNTDIDECLRTMQMWLEANKDKGRLKPIKEMDSYINNWIVKDTRNGYHAKCVNSEATYDLDAYESSSIFDE